MTSPLLSEMEWDLLYGLADGESQAELAARLHVHERTVPAVSMRLRTKLGARSEAHAVARAYHLGLLVPRVAA